MTSTQRTYRYRLHGIIFKSSLRFPELSTTTDSFARSNEDFDARGQMMLSRSRARDTNSRRAVVEWISPPLPEKVGVGRRGDHYVFELHDGVTFELNPSLNHVTYRYIGRVEPEAVRLCFMHQVVPYTLSLRGHLMLHAAAIMSDGRAFLILGESGAGKSTLTTAFALASFRFLSDDVVRLTRDEGRHRWLAHPSIPVPRVRLAPFEKMSKEWPHLGEIFRLHRRQLNVRARVPSLAAQASATPMPIPVAAAYVLRSGDSLAPKIVPISIADALVILGRSTYFLSADDPEQWASQLRTLTDLLVDVPHYALSYSHAGEGLASVVRDLDTHFSRIRHPA